MILVTSELRGRFGPDGAFVTAGKVDSLSRGLPRCILMRVVGRGDSPQEVLVLPVHQSTWIAPVDIMRWAVTSLLAVHRSEVVWAVTPGVVSSIAISAAVLLRRPLVVNVVGDPAEATKRGVIRHPLRPVASWLLPRIQRVGCRRADVVRYVSEGLREIYPASTSRQFVLSNVTIAGIASPRQYGRSAFRLITVASLEQPYKGLDTVILAFAQVLASLPNCTLTIVGEGRLRTQLERLATSVAPGRVSFTGHVSPEEVLRLLSVHGIFVLASRTEGMPRAMIEAMASGLPCIGSRVGGIQELLADSCTFPPGHHAKAAQLLLELLSTPEAYEEASASSIRIASAYTVDAVRDQVTEFRRSVMALLPEEIAAPRSSMSQATLSHFR